MYKVETHNNSKEYFQKLCIDNDAIYITSNNAIADMMRCICKVDKKDEWRIIDIDQFNKAIYSRWNNTIIRIKLKAQLRLTILEFKAKLTDINELKEVRFFEDNLEFMISDFILLFEAGIRRININSKDVKYKLLNDIYISFIQTELFKEASGELLNNECFSNIKSKVENYYKSRKKEYEINSDDNIKIKKIYFYNLNFIDLKRYLLIEKISLSGYEVIFRIPYFNNVNNINKCWDDIYLSNKDIFKFERHTSDETLSRYDVKYINYFNNKENISNTDEKVIIKEYEEIYQLKDDLKDSILITFCKDSLSSIMEKNKDNLREHCYQSSVGRFIFYIYKCKLENKTVKMDFNIYREMITSGWINLRNNNIINKLSSFLLDNADYFLGVNNIDEIINRLKSIKEAQKAGKIFEEEAKLRIKDDEVKAFLSNPFRVFGYLNTNKYGLSIDIIIEATRELKEFIINVLKGDNEVLNVDEHLNLMQNLFGNSKYIRGLYSNGNLEEKNILKKIFSVLSNPKHFGEKIHKSEMAELFYNFLYLDEKLKDNSEGEKNFSVDQLEGIILRRNIFGNEMRICLSDLSHKSYEEYINKYKTIGKILSDEEIIELFDINLQDISRARALKGMELKNQSEKATEAYLKFALCNLFVNFEGSKEFSWIKSLRKDDAQSVILKQIESIYRCDNTEKNENKKEDKNEFYIPDFNGNELYVYDEKIIKDNKKKLPEVAFKDLDLCGEKFLYCSIIGNYPIYYSDFHNIVAFSVLINIFKNSMEDSYKKIHEFIFPLFPQWEDVVKNNILDYEFGNKKINLYKYYDGINYPKSMDGLYLLKSKYGKNPNTKIKRRYNKEEFDGEIYYKEFIKKYINEDEIKSGVYCMMCPHCYLCKKGDFIIDYK